MHIHEALPKPYCTTEFILNYKSGIEYWGYLYLKMILGKYNLFFM